MKTIILAAGKSTRLMPLTKDIPQPMLRVGEKTILETQVGNLKKAGLQDIVVITGYLSQKLEAFCQELGIKTSFNPFYDVSGTAATLWVAKEELRDGFLFLYSDILFDFEIIGELLKTKQDICLAIKRNALRDEAEQIVEERGIVKSVRMKPEGGNSEFIGIAKFSGTGAKKIIEELGRAIKNDLGVSFINIIDNLVRGGEIVATLDIKDAQFIDIDFPQDLERAKNN